METNTSTTGTIAGAVQHLCNNGTNYIYLLQNGKLYRYSLLGNLALIGTLAAGKTYSKGYYTNGELILFANDGIYSYSLSSNNQMLLKEHPDDLTSTNSSIMGTDGCIYIIGNVLSDDTQRIYRVRSNDLEIYSYMLFETANPSLVAGDHVIYIGNEKINLNYGSELRTRTNYEYNNYDQLVHAEKSRFTYELGYCFAMVDYTRSWTYVDGYNAPLTYTDEFGNTTSYTYPAASSDNISSLTYLYPATVMQYSNTDAPVVTTNTRSADNKKIVSSSTNYGDSVDTVTYTYDTAYEGNVTGETMTTAKNGTTQTVSQITYTYTDGQNDGTNNNAYVASKCVYNTTNSADFSGTVTQNQTVNYEYNTLGLVDKAYTYNGSTLVSTSYTYNKNGVLTKVVYPDNTFVEYTYTFGTENKLVTSYNDDYYTVAYYDGLGRCIHTGESSDGETLINTVTYGYKHGNLSYAYDISGLYVYYYYETYGRLRAIIYMDDPLQEEEHTILYKKEYAHNDADITVTTYISNDYTYYTQDSYDSLGRLRYTYVIDVGTVASYTYDQRGNLA